MSKTNASAVNYTELLRNNRNFRWLWGGQIVSLLGDWFNLIASAALLSKLTESGLAIGSLFVVRMLAPFIIAPFAGVIADRYNRKWILIASDIFRGVSVLGFLLVRNPNDVWLLYTLTAVQLGLGGFFYPARNAILPDLVKPEEIGAANAISSATWSTMLAIGAALGGLVAGLWGNEPAFILDALTFVVSAVLIAKIDYQLDDETTKSDKSLYNAIQQYLDGIRYLRKRGDQFIITLLKGTNAILVSTGFQIIQVVIAEDLFVIGESGGISLGLMFGVAGIGTGLGPILARYITKDDNMRLRWAIAAGWIIASIGLFILSSLASFPIVLFGTFLRGFGGGIVWVFATQLLLQLVPGDVRGRIFATEYMIFTLLAAFGAAGVGWALDGVIGIATLVRMMGVAILVPTALWLIWTRYQGRISAESL
ncbi:MAG: MFS transporter [Candidatus Promineifilaceae bacterium]